MLEIRKILCPVDFSDFSRNAFDLAVAIARLHRAAVTALHVVPLFPLSSIVPYPGAGSVHAFAPPEIDRGRISDELRRFLGADSAGVTVASEVGEAPDVAWEIVARADRLPADLIVMGTHGRSGFQRLMLGSIAEKVLRVARQPVLTVPGDAPKVVPAGAPPFRRILVATDFSECSTAALGYTASLAAHPDTRTTVLHVVEITEPPYNPLVNLPVDLIRFQRMCQEAGRDELHRTVPAAMRQTGRVDEVIATGKPHREIVRIAGEQHSDLIVMGIHGRNTVDRLMFGSTTEPVVRHATCPVLTVRSLPGAATAAA